MSRQNQSHKDGESPEQVRFMKDLAKELALARPVWDLFSQSQKERLLALDSAVPCKMGDLFLRLAQEKERSNKK